ncbi:MAG: YhcH/YjgK/YiaL family protein [Verrucomicrobiota bacterium]
MLFDHIEYQAVYRHSHDRLAAAFDYLIDLRADAYPGEYELQGRDIFAIISCYETQPVTDKDFESHRNYLDLQYILEGEEILYHSPLDCLSESVPYDEERDLIFYQGIAEQALIMRPGYFCVLFPQDAHIPGCHCTGISTVKKVVVKVRL